MKGFYFAVLFVLLSTSLAGELETLDNDIINGVVNKLDKGPIDYCFYVTALTPIFGTVFAAIKCAIDFFEYDDFFFCLEETGLSIIAGTLMSTLICSVV
jgi:hypothetical protein